MGEAFLHWSEVQGYSKHTVRLRRRYIKLFYRWCLERGLQRPSEVSRAVLQRYQSHLHHLVLDDGRRLSRGTQLSRLNVLRAFFKWLGREGHVLLNPAAELKLPFQGKRLPKEVLTAAEAEAVLAVPALHTAVGLRDRAILELFYLTGLRRAELAALRVVDLELEQQLLRVRKGKGGRCRHLPLGSRAAAWVGKYLLESRPKLLCPPPVPELFLTSLGQAMRPKHLSALVSGYVKSAGIGKQGSCHLLRHSMATLMLEGGADIRFIQQMLGHEKLTTTQLYTHVSVLQLRRIHAATHPAELAHGALFEPGGGLEVRGELEGGLGLDEEQVEAEEEVRVQSQVGVEAGMRGEG